MAFDPRPEMVHLIAEGGTAFLEARFVGRHIGDFAGVPATGPQVAFPYCVVYDIAGRADHRASLLRGAVAMRTQLAEATAAGRTGAAVAG